MRKGGISVAGMSVLFALGLAAWEVYFFWFAGSFKHLEGTLGLFTPDRLGFNMAWLAAAYLTFQLIWIPFSLPTTANRFIGVVDGMASLVPLAIVLDRFVWQVVIDRYAAALGSRLSADLHHPGQLVRRIHVQYCAQPPDHGRRAGCAGLTVTP